MRHNARKRTKSLLLKTKKMKEEKCKIARNVASKFLFTYIFFPKKLWFRTGAAAHTFQSFNLKCSFFVFNEYVLCGTNSAHSFTFEVEIPIQRGKKISIRFAMHSILRQYIYLNPYLAFYKTHIIRGHAMMRQRIPTETLWPKGSFLKIFIVQ